MLSPFRYKAGVVECRESLLVIALKHSTHAFAARGAQCLCKTRTRPDSKDGHTKRHFFSLVWNINNSKMRIKSLIRCTLCVNLESTARMKLNVFQFLFLVNYKAFFRTTARY